MREVQNGDKYLECSKYGNGILHLLVYCDIIHRLTSALQCYLYSIYTVRLQKHKISSATIAETEREQHFGIDCRQKMCTYYI